MSSHYPVIVIGGGQSGLSISYYLKQHNIDHLVFEKHQIGHAWRAKRWDSFCLVTPNWQCNLPGFPYPGNDPHGFMVKDEIVQYIEAYAAAFSPPIKQGVTVERLQRSLTGQFLLSTTLGEFSADQVVVATGSYHRPKIPACAQRLPTDIQQIHSSEYKNPQSLPDKPVLVVGTGQSGCQIAEDLHLAGRQVHLCVGGAPRSPRQYRGQDVVDWLDQMKYYDLPIDQHPQREKVRSKTNHYVTGRDGGKEIDLRQFALEGMALYGRLQDIQGTILRLKPDLKHNLAQADAVAESIKRTIDGFIEQQQIVAPVDPPYVPAWEPTTEITELDYRVADIGTVIWSIGYAADFSWIDLPVFDGRGYPGHTRGVTPIPGLYFLGLPWLYTWGSGRFSGIARDAAHLADQILAHSGVARSRPTSAVNDMALGS